ncbi:Precorrin-8X methylmutase [Nymphon striatum]|nr:Precorrin-8X methylmutase [Nymphon striatum]
MHSKNDIPTVLNTYAAKHGMAVSYGRELGVDPKMIAAAAGRITDAVAAANFKHGHVDLHDTCLVVIGRGASDPDANGNVAKIARMLHEGIGFGWVEVGYSGVTFPLVEPCLSHAAKLGYKRILVFPYFLFSGILIDRIYGFTDQVAAQHPDIQFVKADYLGDHPKVLETFAERIIEQTGSFRQTQRTAMRPYETNPSAIYAQSFATVQAEARLERFPLALHPLITRLIHSCGMVEIADRLAGAPILCDCEMVGAGIIRRYLPKANEVIVTLNDPRTRDHAKQIDNTRSAAAVEFWEPHIKDAVVAIGNAPTALFHLLDLIDKGFPKPAIILGFPVGFVGAAESKAELAANPRGTDFVALRGRKGGSAMASAAVNALAAGLPEITK